jgi:hypothetical protein
MKFKLEIDCENDAFGSMETARILKVLAAALEDNGEGPWLLFDEDGNRVGAALTQDEAIDVSVRLRTAMLALTSALEVLKKDDPLRPGILSAFRLVVDAHLAAIERATEGR